MSLLKSMRPSEERPRVKVCQASRMTVGEEKACTLIDGGATRCLHQCRSQEEWIAAVPIKVQLASGETEMKQDIKASTLLVQRSIQPIVPVSKLVDLGYVVNWSKDRCIIENGKHGRNPIQMCQGTLSYGTTSVGR